MFGDGVRNDKALFSNSYSLERWDSSIVAVLYIWSM